MFKLTPILIFSIVILSAKITNYKPIFNCISNNKTELIAIRSFTYKNSNGYLAVEPNTLKSYLVNASKYSVIKCNQAILQSRYRKLLHLSLSNQKHPLQNDGIVNIGSGMHITTDLCPSSKKGFEDGLYIALIKSYKNPVPVTIFITKKWINSHNKEFEQLKKWNKDSNLSITWGNHTAYHTYHPKEPLEHNFVLSKGENLTKDILDLEVELINRGVTPSVFFRFPGLVSNKKSIEKVASLGLITIGSDAWIAKGETPKNGSIVLLHGNKNEPKGVEMFLKMLKSSTLKLQPTPIN